MEKPAADSQTGEEQTHKTDSSEGPSQGLSSAVDRGAVETGTRGQVV